MAEVDEAGPRRLRRRARRPAARRRPRQARAGGGAVAAPLPRRRRAALDATRPPTSRCPGAHRAAQGAHRGRGRPAARRGGRRRPVARRDRAILEVLYGIGPPHLRARGPVAGRRRPRAERMLRVFGKGSKERIVPLGRWRRSPACLARPRRSWRARARALARRDDADAVFLNLRGRPADPAGRVGHRAAVRPRGRGWPTG